jgi:hypothetical protein
MSTLAMRSLSGSVGFMAAPCSEITRIALVPRP